MLDDGWQQDTQLLSWVLSYDKVNSFEPLAICAASAATAISEIPFSKPIAGVEVGIIDNEIVINPTKEQAANSTLQLTMAGTKEGILMIEGFANFLPDDIFMNAMKKVRQMSFRSRLSTLLTYLLINLLQGHEAIGQICDAISELAKVAGKPKKTDALRVTPKDLLEKMDEVSVHP